MKHTAALRRRILNRSAAVGIIGQGYVGLSLACAAAEAGFSVVGLDVDEERIEGLAEGILSVPGVDEAAFTAATATGSMRFTTDPAALDECEIMVICVP